MDEYKVQYCDSGNLYSLEFFQIPVMLGYGNSCGNIIHQVSSSYFLNLTYIFAIIGIKSVQNIQSNSVFALFFKKYYNMKSLKTFYFINGALWFFLCWMFMLIFTI
ncbi:Hypothetical_protein [Hexamita inflata]|uniref:Hypothetical_protein n=1 Tax=Hexamita inflata TaxID=28002 RepID=A0AA86VK31_9EUKA|nr:Hypothetical protein HINF_LOCUS56553 [Hexamita inflata]